MDSVLPIPAAPFPDGLAPWRALVELPSILTGGFGVLGGFRGS
jgi:hypothetical protein